MVYRIYVEKKSELDNGAKSLLSAIRGFLGIKGVVRVRILNRYDAENITKELFDYSVRTVFSEPMTDIVYSSVENDGATVFVSEYLPGQFDQRADSAAQCIQLISMGNRPTVKTARVYMLYGKVTREELEKIKKYVINPVESRETDDAPRTSIETAYEIPKSVLTLTDFNDLDEKGLASFISEIGRAHV